MDSISGAESPRETRYLSPVNVWALSFGCAVSWGAFVMPGTTFLPSSGPWGTALGIGIGAVVMLIIGMNYHFMMNKYPDAAAALGRGGVSGLKPAFSPGGGCSSSCFSSHSSPFLLQCTPDFYGFGHLNRVFIAPISKPYTI